MRDKPEMPRRTILDASRREFDLIKELVSQDYGELTAAMSSLTFDDEDALLEQYTMSNGMGDSSSSESSTSESSEDEASVVQDPHAFDMGQDSTSAQMRKKKVKATESDRKTRREAPHAERALEKEMLAGVKRMNVKAVYWDMKNEAASTLKSASNILKEVGWTEMPFIFMFVGGSTIHIGVRSVTTDDEGNKHEGVESLVSLNAKKPGDDITMVLRKLAEKPIFSKGKKIRMLLSGSPTTMTTKFNPESSVKFFDNLKEDKVSELKQSETDPESTAKAQLTYLYENLANESSKVGGLQRGKKDDPNPGRDILKRIIDAMDDSANWHIVCGSRHYKDSNGKKPFYCTDSTFVNDFLPADVNPPVEIISSGDVKQLMSTEPSKKRRDVLHRMSKQGLTLLVTAGHTQEDRAKNVGKVNAKIMMGDV